MLRTCSRSPIPRSPSSSRRSSTRCARGIPRSISRRRKGDVSRADSVRAIHPGRVDRIGRSRRYTACGGRLRTAGYVLVSGHTMLPRYHTGDLLLVEHKSSYHVGEVIAYRVPKGDPMQGAQVLRIPNAVVVLPFLRSPALLGLLAASFVFVNLLLGGKKQEMAEPATP